jgi:hypothetical protein
MSRLWTKFKFHLNLRRRITGTSHEYLFTFMAMSRWILLRMRNVAHRWCTEIQDTHFTFSNSFFRKWCRLWDKMWKKYGIVREATGDNMVNAPCVLDRKGYKHTLRICHSCCFSTARWVTRTCLNNTLNACWFMWRPQFSSKPHVAVSIGTRLRAGWEDNRGSIRCRCWELTLLTSAIRPALDPTKLLIKLVSVT